MGNCLEPSESEVMRARRAKLRKMAAHEASLAAAGIPPSMGYPYSVDPYSDPRLSGVYIPAQSHSTPMPSAYAVVDPRTGQGFIVHDPGPLGMSGPYIDERMMYHNDYNHNHTNNNSISSKNKHSSKGRSQRNDDIDGNSKADRKSYGKRSSLAVSVKQQTTEDSNEDGPHTKVSAEVVGSVDVHSTQNQTTHPNGSVGMELFTKSGVMDLEAETETIIIDFLDPIPPTITTEAETHTTLSKIEYESANENPAVTGIDTGYSFNNNDSDQKTHILARLPSTHSEAEESSGVQGESSTFFELGNSTKSEQHKQITDEKSGSSFKFNHHSEEIDIFPPKNNDDGNKTRDIPDILMRTLSQSSTSGLPTDAVDVVITYSVLGEYQLDIVRRLTRQLELVGLTVWAERLGDSSKARKSDKTAQAILGAKVLIVMLSEGSCDQRFIRDHVAMATLTNISIFPVASEPPKDVEDAMPRELKVQLTPYDWTELTGGNEDSFLFQVRSLARSVQDEVEEQNSSTSKERAHRGNVNHRKKSLTNHGMTASAASFWDVHFGHRDSVRWERLEHTLKDTFKMIINDTIPENMQLLLFTSIKNWTVKENANVSREDFVAMCQSDNKMEMDVWGAMVQVAGMMQAVRDVFDIESTVRHFAVDYTEHFSNPSVLRALRDLLSDLDPNFRSVAVVSLARCMAAMSDSKFLEWVERTLEDGDRLVREAGCLALGHLRAESAVQKLIYVWRNDVISQVREAAKMALDQIGGPEVAEAMTVTDVLAKEIRQLTDGTQEG